MSTPSPAPPYNVAVFAAGETLLLLRQEGDDFERASAAAVARGLNYCGALGANAGTAGVQCEPTEEAAVAMLAAGWHYVHLLANHVKAHQLATSEKD